MKKLLILPFCILLSVFLLTGCFRSEILFETDTPEESDGILKIETVKALNVPRPIDYERAKTSYTAQEVMGLTRAVVSGIVKRVEEVRITYLSGNEGQTAFSYMSKITLLVEDIYYLSSKNDFSEGGEVTFWYSNTSNAYSDDLPLLAEDDEIFLFLSTMYSTFTDFGKFVCVSPEDLLFIRENGVWDFSRILNVFNEQMWGIEEGEAPVLGMMHEFFGQ